MKQEMKNILLVGAGGIGSQLIDQLVPALNAGGLAERLGGVRLHLMDSDRVEEANLSHQRHEPRMVGRLKVDSLTERLEPFLSPALTITAHSVDLRRATQLEDYDLVVVAVDRPAARLLVHAHVENWVDLRCGGDGYMALDDETEPQLVTLMTPDDQQPASCQAAGAVADGNIESGYALAAAHGTQWVIQSLRRMLGETTRPPPARMYSLTYGELQFPHLPDLKEENGNAAPAAGAVAARAVANLPSNHGKKWTHADEMLLVQAARDGLMISEMAELLERKSTAIQSHLFKMIDFSQMSLRCLADAPDAADGVDGGEA